MSSPLPLSQTYAVAGGGNGGGGGGGDDDDIEPDDEGTHAHTRLAVEYPIESEALHEEVAGCV
jgi:hypothetical protein